MTTFWWVCRAPDPDDRTVCNDQMAESDRREDIVRDQTSHLREHPDWQPTEQDKLIQHWTER